MRLPGDRLGSWLLRLGRVRREGLAAAGPPSGRGRNPRAGPHTVAGAEWTSSPGPRRAKVGLTDSRALVLVLVARPGVPSEPVVVGEPGSLGTAANAEFPIDVRQVVLDRLLAKPELARDLLVRATCGDPLEDLLLARGEAELLCGSNWFLGSGRERFADELALEDLAQHGRHL